MSLKKETCLPTLTLPSRHRAPPEYNAPYHVADTACCVLTEGAGSDLPCASMPWVSDGAVAMLCRK